MAGYLGLYMYNLLIWFFLSIFTFNTLHAETLEKNCIYKWQTGERKLSVNINKKDKIVDGKFSFDKSSTDNLIRWNSWFKIKNSTNYNIHFLELNLEENNLYYYVAGDVDISINNRLNMLSTNDVWKIIDNFKVKDNKNFLSFIFTCN